EHLAGGVPDRRLDRFPALYEELLRRELPVPAEATVQLHAFAPRFEELCSELESAGLPVSLQHDDLHGENVVVSGSGALVLDWGDSCVSHPFLTAFVCFDHLDLEPDDPWLARLRDAYLEPWGDPGTLRKTFALALRLGAFAHLFKELHVFDAIPESQRAEFAPDLHRLVLSCVGAIRCC
ncbi:MAG: phosphotransferase, partial [Gaiellaceae bacterium]